MFRIVQGDVGSGKTIITLLSIANVIESGYQTAYMGPTEILAFQHFQLAKKIFEKEKIVIEFLSGKTNNNKRKLILNKLKEGKIDLIIGTHAFSKKVDFNNLGIVVIDEQHKFGVRQRTELAKKGV